MDDVSTRQSFDLLCTKGQDVERRVEVKGTASDGSTILLTPNEVDHARNQYPNVDLFIVANINVIDGDPVSVTGDDERVIDAWDVDEGVLLPVGFSYGVPLSHVGRTEDAQP